MKTYCVATAIIQYGDKYFVAKRANTKKIAPGLWEFVTGFIEDHEAAQETILRELEEEIDLKGTIVKELDVVQMKKGNEHWVIIPFVVQAPSTDIKTKPQEHSTGKWATWDELNLFEPDEFRYDLRLFNKLYRYKG